MGREPMCLSPPLEDDDVKESSSVALAFVARKLPNQQNLTERFLFFSFYLPESTRKKKQTENCHCRVLYTEKQNVVCFSLKI